MKYCEEKARQINLGELVVIVIVIVIVVIVGGTDGNVDLFVADAHRDDRAEVESVLFLVARADHEKIALEELGNYYCGMFDEVLVARLGGFVGVVFMGHGACGLSLGGKSLCLTLPCASPRGLLAAPS